MDYSSPGSSVHGILQVKIPGEWAPFPSSGDLSDPGIEPGVPIAGRFFTILATRNTTQ